MAENSNIEWTDHTFNPWMGCTKVSPACKHCYAERDMDHRYGKVAWGPNGTRVLTSVANWQKPLKWEREAAEALQFHKEYMAAADPSCRRQPPRRPRVFCASLADVFEDWDGPIGNSEGQVWTKPFLQREQVRDNWQLSSPEDMEKDPQGWLYVTLADVRRQLFWLIDATPHLDWLLLTKRPENVEQMWPCTNDSDNDGHCNVCIRASNASCRKRKNVWLGTSIENQDFANKRLPYLHGAKRYGLCDTTFVSAEPLVGPIMLHGEVDGFKYRHLQEPGIDWVITGGESGPDARPSHSDWYRSLLRQCIRSGTPFFFKQWGEWCPGGFGGIHSSKPVTFVTIDGQTSQDASLWETDDGVEMQTRVGKKVAGRLLDGLVWNEFPAAIDEVAA